MGRFDASIYKQDQQQIREFTIFALQLFSQTLPQTFAVAQGIFYLFFLKLLLILK